LRPSTSTKARTSRRSERRDPVDLELEIDHAAVASKRSGQAVNARMPAVVLGLAPIASRQLTITRCLGPVVSCLLAVAGCLLALAR
jgi:hypothetical protein